MFSAHFLRQASDYAKATTDRQGEKFLRQASNNPAACQPKFEKRRLGRTIRAKVEKKFMQLFIITPNKKELFDVSWIEFNTANGNFVIQPGHAPTIFALSEQKPFIYCLKNGKQEVVMVKRAIAEITRSQITVLLSHFD